MRGAFMHRYSLDIHPATLNKPGAAQMACRELCDKRYKCCNQCVKPVGNKFYCTLNEGRFGGWPDQDIEAISMRRDDETCAYKDFGHWDINCMAQ